MNITNLWVTRSQTLFCLQNASADYVGVLKSKYFVII